MIEKKSWASSLSNSWTQSNCKKFIIFFLLFLLISLELDIISFRFSITYFCWCCCLKWASVNFEITYCWHVPIVYIRTVSNEIKDSTRNEDGAHKHTRTHIHLICDIDAVMENRTPTNERSKKLNWKKMDNIIKASDGRSIWDDAHTQIHAHTLKKLNVILILYVYYSTFHESKWLVRKTKDATHRSALNLYWGVEYERD